VLSDQDRTREALLAARLLWSMPVLSERLMRVLGPDMRRRWWTIRGGWLAVMRRCICICCVNTQHGCIRFRPRAGFGGDGSAIVGRVCFGCSCLDSLAGFAGCVAAFGFVSLNVTLM
jgi:hypothetical protein